RLDVQKLNFFAIHKNLDRLFATHSEKNVHQDVRDIFEETVQKIITNLLPQDRNYHHLKEFLLYLGSKQIQDLYKEKMGQYVRHLFDLLQYFEKFEIKDDNKMIVLQNLLNLTPLLVSEGLDFELNAKFAKQILTISDSKSSSIPWKELRQNLISTKLPYIIQVFSKGGLFKEVCQLLKQANLQQIPFEIPASLVPIILADVAKLIQEPTASENLELIHLALNSLRAFRFPENSAILQTSIYLSLLKALIAPDLLCSSPKFGDWAQTWFDRILFLCEKTSDFSFLPDLVSELEKQGNNIFLKKIISFFKKQRELNKELLTKVVLELSEKSLLASIVEWGNLLSGFRDDLLNDKVITVINTLVDKPSQAHLRIIFPLVLKYRFINAKLVAKIFDNVSKIHGIMFDQDLVAVYELAKIKECFPINIEERGKLLLDFLIILEATSHPYIFTLMDDDYPMFFKLFRKNEDFLNELTISLVNTLMTNQDESVFVIKSLQSMLDFLSSENITPECRLYENFFNSFIKYSLQTRTTQGAYEAMRNILLLKLYFKTQDIPEVYVEAISNVTLNILLLPIETNETLREAANHIFKIYTELMPRSDPTPFIKLSLKQPLALKIVGFNIGLLFLKRCQLITKPVPRPFKEVYQEVLTNLLSSPNTLPIILELCQGSILNYLLTPHEINRLKCLIEVVKLSFCMDDSKREQKIEALELFHINYPTLEWDADTEKACFKKIITLLTKLYLEEECQIGLFVEQLINIMHLLTPINYKGEKVASQNLVKEEVHYILRHIEIFSTTEGPVQVDPYRKRHGLKNVFYRPADSTKVVTYLMEVIDQVIKIPVHDKKTQLCAVFFIYIIFDYLIDHQPVHHRQYIPYCEKLIFSSLINRNFFFFDNIKHINAILQLCAYNPEIDLKSNYPKLWFILNVYISRDFNGCSNLSKNRKCSITVEILENLISSKNEAPFIFALDIFENFQKNDLSKNEDEHLSKALKLLLSGLSEHFHASQYEVFNFKIQGSDGAVTKKTAAHRVLQIFILSSPNNPDCLDWCLQLFDIYLEDKKLSKKERLEELHRFLKRALNAGCFKLKSKEEKIKALFDKMLDFHFITSSEIIPGCDARELSSYFEATRVDEVFNSSSNLSPFEKTIKKYVADKWRALLEKFEQII
nr:hypothetical protein [Nitrosopumilus sp.]